MSASILKPNKELKKGNVMFDIITTWNNLGHNIRELRYYSTEVSRAPLIHFQKIFFQKDFYRSKLARELKFYTWIIIEGSKSLKKGQKMLKKATNLV